MEIQLEERTTKPGKDLKPSQHAKLQSKAVGFVLRSTEVKGQGRILELTWSPKS